MNAFKLQLEHGSKFSLSLCLIRFWQEGQVRKEIPARHELDLGTKKAPKNVETSARRDRQTSHVEIARADA